MNKKIIYLFMILGAVIGGYVPALWGAGLFSMSSIFGNLLGGLAGLLNFSLVFFIRLGDYVGNLMTNSGRSGLFSSKMKDYPEESAAIDTIFSPLAVAFGGLLGGILVSFFGYPLIFVFGGILVFIAGIVGKRFVKL